MRLRELELSVARVKSVIVLLEAIEYNDNTHRALKDLRLILAALEFELDSLSKEGVVEWT